MVDRAAEVARQAKESARRATEDKTANTYVIEIYIT
jgi:hypothetical protein